jgi:hypothetical protein
MIRIRVVRWKRILIQVEGIVDDGIVKKMTGEREW